MSSSNFHKIIISRQAHKARLPSNMNGVVESTCICLLTELLPQRRPASGSEPPSWNLCLQTTTCTFAVPPMHSHALRYSNSADHSTLVLSALCGPTILCLYCRDSRREPSIVLLHQRSRTKHSKPHKETDKGIWHRFATMSYG